MLRVALVACTTITAVSCARPKTVETNSYDILLHSSSIAEQRAALNTIVRSSREYDSRIQQGLRDYPATLRRDRSAANRSVYLAVLIRDSSFAPILAAHLADSSVVDECIYACPATFALALYAAFGGWTPPATLDTTLTTVSDLRTEMRRVSRMSLDVRPIDSVMQGPMVERHRQEIEGKSEEQLIEIAGPSAPSAGARTLAAVALQTSVASSRNRNELYLLLMNEPQNDASAEYRSSIYEAIYRAETAKARGR